MAVEIVLERLGKPPVKVRGTNIVPVEVGDRIVARSINGVRRMYAPPIVAAYDILVIDLQAIRFALARAERQDS